ncbi:MAG TPA: hypothetical protein VHT26_18305 [Trebonia sp.]|nr:hypothetical protein [Trebonia sp.]
MGSRKFSMRVRPHTRVAAAELTPRWRGTAERHTLIMMNSASARNRRYLPSSPFKPPPEAPPAEQYELDDMVTHEKYGLGRVILVEGDTAVVVDFAPRKVRIMSPFARMIKL